MSLTVIPIESKRDLTRFIKFPWKIYKGNNCWVPPLIKDMRDTLDPKKNDILNKGQRQAFLALLDGEPAGRIYTGIDNVLNEKKNIKLGYFSLFECINDDAVAKALFDEAFKWFIDRSIKKVIGPVSPIGADGDEYKGLLIDCFDKPPAIMNPYNPPYYKNLMENNGFEKDYDVFAYYLSKDILFEKNPEKVIEYAQKRYNFRVDTLDLKNIDKEIRDIKHVIDISMPEEWPDLVPPSVDEVKEMAKKMLTYADPDLIAIARSGDEAIGFAMTLPDYNQVLIHMNGRLNPISALKYLWYKRKINGARAFGMFVAPAFRSKGVSYAIYYKAFKNGVNKGYIHGEGSTIGEENVKMRADIESFGGKKYKTYRILKKEFEI